MCVPKEVQNLATVSEVMRRVHERQLYRVMGSIGETRPDTTCDNEEVMQRDRQNKYLPFPIAH